MEKVSAACAMDWSIKLEKALRSKNPGRAVEVILETGEKLQQWSKEPEPGTAVYSLFGLVPEEDSSLMRGLFKAGLSEEAMQVWGEMGCSRNEVCYSVLIDGLCGVGKVNEAMMVWSEMLTTGIKPDTVAYSSMIKGLCGIGSIDAALRLYHEMLCQEEPNSQPDVVTYNILLDGLCVHKDVSRAVDLLNCMLDRGCDPDVITCNVFLKSLREKSGACDEGRRFLEELVVRLLKRQRVPGACKIVEVMLSKYLAPKGSTWGLIVPEICKPKKISAAIDKCWRNLCT
ncbi:hypothetical protein F2Q68_00029565 [Brassica cretica]|uniref:Pentatricopeptide repeat-containing protein n=1 Tax=Brassica cretica TaxID=69181 RepID=A0A8S9GGU5_BRACR|nr:hypothetical protein F2Q68_00029565 [Brassica cretica]